MQTLKSNWRWLIYFGLLVVFINPIVRVIFHDDARPSPVDASPIAKLNAELIEPERIIRALDSLQDHDKVWRFERHMRPERNWELTYWFSYGYRYNLVTIRVYFYHDEQQLVYMLPRRTYEHAKRGSIAVESDNNTQAFLHASFMERSHGRSMPRRLIRTELRLGSVYISMREERHYQDLYPNASSDFIRLLYELLTAEE